MKKKYTWKILEDGYIIMYEQNDLYATPMEASKVMFENFLKYKKTHMYSDDKSYSFKIYVWEA